MSLFTDRQLVGLVALGGLGVYLAARAARQGLEAVNPADPDNAINQRVNEGFGFDNVNNSLGSYLFDVLNPGQGDLLNLDE